MIRTQRLLYYFLTVLLFCFVLSSLLPTFRYATSEEVSPSPSTEFNTEEKYLSWFPHGGFAEQHEAFRNAIRLAYDTNRTIIVPMLRLGTSYAWSPFEDLAKQYEAQDKSVLRQLCKDERTDWRTQLEPCDSLDTWTEIPWSSLFDLEPFKAEYGLRIVERKSGHGWGIHESAVSGFQASDVVVVDVMTFAENSTASAEKNLYQKIQQQFSAKTKLMQPLKNVFSARQLRSLNARLVQFGALSSAMRYRTSGSKGLPALQRAMNKHLFVTPNNMSGLTVEADRVIERLGGPRAFSSLHLNLNKLIALDGRVNKQQNGTRITVDSLDLRERRELMDAVILEVFADIPINQAVSVASPIQPSRLYDLLSSNSTDTPAGRQQLLTACIEYKHTVEKQYPIYYLVNDYVSTPQTRPDVFGALLEFNPCVFTRADMQEWQVVDMLWTKYQLELMDEVDYSVLLGPVLDILVASKV
ncbi:hypothetical protein DFQ28_003583 [Apophysomyces sp. BC1034]|nr:hypothetical protein DFQ28_003583 [Apophysomyces sp. BC1034]